MLFTFNPLLAGLAGVCLVTGLVVGVMGHLTLVVMQPPRTAQGRQRRWLLRAFLSAVTLGGLCVGLFGLYVAL